MDFPGGKEYPLSCEFTTEMVIDYVNKGYYDKNTNVDDDGYLKMEDDSPKEILEENKDPDYDCFYLTTMTAEQRQKFQHADIHLSSVETMNLQQHSNRRSMINCGKVAPENDQSCVQKRNISEIVIPLVIGILSVIISVSLTIVYFSFTTNSGE